MRTFRSQRRLASLYLAVLFVLLAVLGVLSAPAFATSEGTGWEAFAQAFPTYLHPGGKGQIQVALFNTGAKPSSGAITVTDTLPEGMVATAAGGEIPPNGELGKEVQVESEAEEVKQFGDKRWDCTGAGTREVTCTSDPRYMRPLPSGIGLFGGAAHLSEFVVVEVEIEKGISEGTPENRVTVSGGGATGVSAADDKVTVSASEPGFGFSNWNVWFSNAEGEISTQAGSHPYETTIALALNKLANGEVADRQARNLEVELPPGFFGEPNNVPRCSRGQLDAVRCPADTQIGVDFVALFDGVFTPLPVYNLVPAEGVVDEFGFEEAGVPSFFDTGPRGYGDYRLVTHVNNIPDIHFRTNILTLWGVAPEANHNDERFGAASVEEEFNCTYHGCSSNATPRPFLTLPTSCEGPQSFTIHGHSTWADPGAVAEASVLSHNAQDEPAGFTDCSALSFAPSLSAVPDTGQADTPAGLGVNVTFPQEALRSPEGLVEATDKNTTVTLPEGLVINPGQAAGLTACSATQARLHEEGPAECSSSAKVGTVKVKTPLLEGEIETELEGDAYVLEQSKGGPGEPLNLQSHPPTLQLLIALSGDGVNLKLIANVALNEQTGRLTTTLAETPAVPFTSFELKFSGGAQAALATPTQCGTYTATSDFTPWTSPFAGDAFPSSSFQITGGPDGEPCLPATLPFYPELIAGATTDQAGGFTGFSMLLRRGDGQQRIERLQFKAPQGLSGILSSVPLCGEAQAQAGTCSAASQIGHSTVASGPGPYPLVIPQPGNPESPIYLTGPYDGAPFGLSIVTHVIAGPFNLGNVITRAKIEVDPLTAQITVTTEPLPQIIDGVPTDLRLVDAVIDRPGFMVNPTDCDPSSFSGTAWGTPPPGSGGLGASAPIESHFQVGSCRSLEFKPSIKVSTSGKTSRADGTSLSVKLTYPKAPQGTQANIRYVKVDLPRQLPSRLTTLQKACLARVFEANPASCPAASRVGAAKVLTPILPVALEGPAYFVSYGDLKFPELVFVLQGDGVTVDLHGETYIGKSGITSSTFRAVPDQQFSSFELTLPQGPYSALANNGDLCKPTKTVTVEKKVTLDVHGHKQTVTRKVKQTEPASLEMPTALIGQNGAEIHQTTPIAVSGCPKAEAKKARKAGRGKGARGKKR